MPANAVLAEFEPIKSRKPLVDVFGHGDLRRGLYVLNMAGLSEAYLYLSRFEELSSGQKYRAMVARMIDSGANVWVADDFCSVLDPVTAKVVAYNIRKCATKVGATVILASPHFHAFIDTLLPDVVVLLSGARGHTIYTGRDFLERMGL